MTLLAGVALAVGGLAVLRQAVGLALLLRFLRRARVASIPKGPTPPLTLIKPLYGADPGLEENLVATLRQNYPEFEVLFVHERPDDPAGVERHQPRVDVRVADVNDHGALGQHQPRARPGVVHQAEVGDPRTVALVDQDVLRLDVAMDQTGLMGMLERVGHVHRVSRRLFRL